MVDKDLSFIFSDTKIMWCIEEFVLTSLLYFSLNKYFTTLSLLIVVG